MRGKTCDAKRSMMIYSIYWEYDDDSATVEYQDEKVDERVSSPSSQNNRADEKSLIIITGLAKRS